MSGTENIRDDIYGVVKDRNIWRRIFIHELYKLYNEPDVVRTIKINRLKWQRGNGYPEEGWKAQRKVEGLEKLEVNYLIFG